MHRRLLLLGLPLLAALPAAARAPRRTQDPDVVFPEAGRRAWAAEVARRLPRGRLAVVPRGAHGMAFSHPGPLAAAITPFLLAEDEG